MIDGLPRADGLRVSLLCTIVERIVPSMEYATAYRLDGQRGARSGVAILDLAVVAGVSLLSCLTSCWTIKAVWTTSSRLSKAACQMDPSGHCEPASLRVCEPASLLPRLLLGSETPSYRGIHAPSPSPPWSRPRIGELMRSSTCTSSTSIYPAAGPPWPASALRRGLLEGHKPQDLRPPELPSVEHPETTFTASSSGQIYIVIRLFRNCLSKTVQPLITYHTKSPPNKAHFRCRPDLCAMEPGECIADSDVKKDSRSHLFSPTVQLVRRAVLRRTRY